MPKIKTNKSAVKRFRCTGRGLIKRAAANHNHILTKKNAKRKRRLQQLKKVSTSDTPGIKRLLGLMS